MRPPSIVLMVLAALACSVKTSAQSSTYLILQKAESSMGFYTPAGQHLASACESANIRTSLSFPPTVGTPIRRTMAPCCSKLPDRAATRFPLWT